ALQTRRGEGGAAGGGTARHHCHGGEGLRTPEGPHRALSRSRICGRFSPQGKDRDCARRRHGRESNRGDPSRRPNRADRRWENLRLEHRRSHSDQNRGIRTGRHLNRWPAPPLPAAPPSSRRKGIRSMTTAKDALKMIKDNDVKYVDFRFTDPRGKWQHVTTDVSTIEEDTFSEGIMFDGSSIAGWKAIHESDMQLMPDPESACIDPFYAETTLVLV